MAKDNPGVPEWFDLGNYCYLRELSSKSLIQELYIRQVQFEFTNNKENYSAEEITFIKNCITRARNEGQGLPLNYFHIEQLEDHRGKGYHIDVYWNNNIPIPMLNKDDTIHEQLKTSASRLTYGDINQHYKIPLIISTIFNDNYEQIIDFTLHIEYLFRNFKINATCFNDIFCKMEQSQQDNYILLKKNLSELYITIDSSKFFETVVPDVIDKRISIGYYQTLLHLLFRDTPFHKHLTGFNTNILPIKLDLNSPNSKIIEEVKNIINNARTLDHIEDIGNIINKTSNDKSSGGKKIIKSIIEKRVIPYLDLLIWAKEKKYDLTDEWYRETIYPDLIEIFSKRIIYDTIKPMSKNCLNLKWLESFFNFDVKCYNDFEENPYYLYKPKKPKKRE